MVQTQLSLFDHAEAMRAREDGIGRVEAHADALWSDMALQAARATALRFESFIVDAVWDLLPKSAGTDDLRAMGAVMKQAQRLGYISPTDRLVLSNRVSAHRNPRRVWRSLIFGGGEAERAVRIGIQPR